MAEIDWDGKMEIQTDNSKTLGYALSEIERLKERVSALTADRDHWKAASEALSQEIESLQDRLAYFAKQETIE